MSAFNRLPQSYEASLAREKLVEAIFLANRAVVTDESYQE